jgi:hypothetical protein
MKDTQPMNTLNIEQLNALSKEEGNGKFTLCAGSMYFMGEGSGPYLMGDDHDPEFRAEVVDGFLYVVGTFDTLEEAEEAGEEALEEHDAYIIPEAAKTRFVSY